MVKLNGIGNDQDWWKRAVFYQIYPRSFMDENSDGIGDLAGINSRLDYLNDGTTGSLGIDAIWFSPFFTSPDHDYGYDVADYCDIDPSYGSLEDFDRLIDATHSRNIKVLLDLVVNHTSYLHPWFLESRSSKDNPRRDWYIWKDGKGRGNRPPNNWRNNFFGSAWTRDERTGQYYLHSFLKEQPDLNWDNPAVRTAIADVIRFWLERQVDGFRLDVPFIYCKDRQFRNNPPFFARRPIKGGPKFFDRTLPANLMKLFALPELQIKKYNQHLPETHRVLQEFRTILDQYPQKTSVGEIIADDPQVVASYYGENNDELHMNFFFELLHLRWHAGAFRRCIDRWESILPVEAWPAYTFSNHDVVRAISRYDQGGRGDSRARLLTLLLLTLRGTPFIYYGEEIAMKEAKLPKNELKDPVGLKWYPFHRGRDGCRTPMQWNDNIYAGFSNKEPWLPLGPEVEKRNVAYQEHDSYSQLQFTKELIWLRKELPSLIEGDYRSLIEGIPKDCFCYLRQSTSQKLIICLNFSSRRQEINLRTANGNNSILFSTNPERGRKAFAFPLTLEPEEGCLINFEEIDAKE
jgi:alpha-glucosidase